jgi:hypothetical protein
LLSKLGKVRKVKLEYIGKTILPGSIYSLPGRVLLRGKHDSEQYLLHFLIIEGWIAGFHIVLRAFAGILFKYFESEPD